MTFFIYDTYAQKHRKTKFKDDLTGTQQFY